MIQTLRIEIADSVPTAHSCDIEHEILCAAQFDYVKDRISEFICAALPARQRQLFIRRNQAQVVETRGSILLVFCAVLTLPCGIFLGKIAFEYGLIPSRGAGVTVFASALLICGSIFILVNKSVQIGLWSQFIATRVAEFTADLLDRANPGNILRWLAFGMFITGFAVDLLAS
ncbi:hypothetical protein [Nonomuraea sp. NPDC049607]|uniref:hypothetical protein n=1 Tax=Nonomuraea sp. NPDC049607 TaxID=3154732 RepID=UPI003421FDAC